MFLSEVPSTERKALAPSFIILPSDFDIYLVLLVTDDSSETIYNSASNSMSDKLNHSQNPL